MTIQGVNSNFNNFKENFWNSKRYLKAGQILQDTFMKVEKLDNYVQSKGVQPTRFIGTNTAKKMSQNSIGKMAVGLDKSLIETKSLQKLLGVEFTQASKATAKESAKYTITGASKGAVRTAKLLARIPLVGVILEGLFEVPDVVKGFKNGDGFSQVGRSSTKIATGSVGMAVVGSLANGVKVPPKYKAIFNLIAAVIGYKIGAKTGKVAGNVVFGKSIESQKQANHLA